MSATLTSENRFLQASTTPDATSLSPANDGPAAARPGLFVRIFEAIGRSYYVATPDGEGFYVLPMV